MWGETRKEEEEEEEERENGKGRHTATVQVFSRQFVGIEVFEQVWEHA